MEYHLYVVSWAGQSQIMSAPDMDTLWAKIKRNYLPGNVVTIEDSKEKRTYVKGKHKGGRKH